MNNTKRMWSLKQAAAPGTLELYIYGEVRPDGEDWWGDVIRSETSADSFRRELDSHPNISQINVYINSGGGSSRAPPSTTSSGATLRPRPCTLTALPALWPPSSPWPGTRSSCPGTP